MSLPHIVKVFLPGTYTRTVGGQNDGASITFIYKDGKLVGIVRNPPVGPHDPASAGDVAMTALATMTQLAELTDHQELKSFLQGVAKNISSRFGSQISTFLQVGTEEAAAA